MKMLTEKEAQQTLKRNKRRIRELVRLSYWLGVNLTTPSCFKDSLKIINVILVVGSALSMYGHWSLIMRYLDDIPKITESVFTALQTVISMVKMVYYLFMQRKFHRLLYTGCSHDILQQIEIFKEDFPVKKQLKEEIGEIMETIWRNCRRQLIFYFTVCSAVILNYFFIALFVNLYHYIQDTPNYVHRLPLPSVYPIWEDKGMTFPYYPLQMFLSGCADYIVGVAAMSFDGLFIVICLHGVALIETLKALVKHSTSPLIPEARRVTYLRYCILQHQRIYVYLDDVRYTYKHISISQFLLSLVILGIVLFQTSVGLENDFITVIRMIVYMSASGYEIILYCYNGQRLTSASEGLPLSLYSCEWYNESDEFKQMLRMMMMRTNRAYYLDMSWFTVMTLPTLMTMFKTSGSYFLMLKNLSE